MNICPECKAKVDIYVAGFCLSCAGKYITQQAKRIKELEARIKVIQRNRNSVYNQKCRNYKKVIELQERIKELEEGLISIRKSTEIMEARRFAEQALKGE